MQIFGNLKSILSNLALKLVLSIASVTFDTVHTASSSIFLILLFLSNFSLLFLMVFDPCLFKHVKDLVQLRLFLFGSLLSLVVMLVKDLVAFVFLFLK